MNCRKANGLLSAYMDVELSDAEARNVREHLAGCGKCRREYETLCETKRLVASLAIRAPRTDLDDLLRSGLEQSAPPSLAERFSYWWEEKIIGDERLRVRPRIIAATTLFSVAGLWLATVTLDGPRDGHRRLPDADYRQTPSVRFVRVEYSQGHLRVLTGLITPVMNGVPFSHAPYAADDAAVSPNAGPRPLTSAAFAPLGPTPVSFGSFSPNSLISAERAVGY